jgi:hypothetical protein
MAQTTITNNNMTREAKLEESMFNMGQPYKFYSVGRTWRLKRLGNPYFGGEGSEDDWDMDRKIGVAWVIFTREFDEIDKLMKLPEPLAEIDRIWQEEMHYQEQEKIYHWIQEQAGLVSSAQTEAVPDKQGKSEEGSKEAPPAG